MGCSLTPACISPYSFSTLEHKTKPKRVIMSSLYSHGAGKGNSVKQDTVALTLSVNFIERCSALRYAIRVVLSSCRGNSRRFCSTQDPMHLTFLIFNAKRWEDENAILIPPVLRLNMQFSLTFSYGLSCHLHSQGPVPNFTVIMHWCPDVLLSITNFDQLFWRSTGQHVSLQYESFTWCDRYRTASAPLTITSHTKDKQ